MPAETLCQTPYGSFRLRRYPGRPDETLQAWCAADLLLLEAAHGSAREDHTLVVNDDHGALCTALQPQALWTDSALAAQALSRNLAHNARAEVPVIWSTTTPPGEPSLVVLRVPKQLPYFASQLDALAPLLRPGTPLLAAGMDKHLSPRVAELLEQYIGPTERHRGQRKARLFSAHREDARRGPEQHRASYYCDAVAGELHSEPNVFSRDRLDGGSRLLLEQMQTLAPAGTVLDLACGNGVLGLAAFRAGLASTVVFADESAMAVSSARHNAARLFPQDLARFDFHHGDGVAEYDGPEPDLILCNPPFHLNHAVQEYAGRRLLAQCARVLPPGGRLCLVANRHLDYAPVLNRDFQRVERRAQDRRFVVWQATR